MTIHEAARNPLKQSDEMESAVNGVVNSGAGAEQMRRINRLFIRAIIAGTIASSTGARSADLVRDPFLQPFASGSLWNTSLGRGALWGRDGDADVRDLRHVNAGIWSMPIFIGRPGDRSLTFRDLDRDKPLAPVSLPVPIDIHPAGPRDGDRHIIIFAPTKQSLYHYFGCTRVPSGFDCALGQKDDVCGDGRGGYGFGSGVIRRWEIEAGAIRHMLRFSLPVTLTRSGTTNATGQAWPATGEDSFGPERYSGHVLFGSTIGLPADVDIAGLRLSPAGTVLATALRDYGAIQRDTGGDDGLILYAEEAAEGMADLAAMREDLAMIVPHLGILRDQGPRTPNGAGARLRPPAPPLDPRVCPPGR